MDGHIYEIFDMDNGEFLGRFVNDLESDAFSKFEQEHPAAKGVFGSFREGAENGIRIERDGQRVTAFSGSIRRPAGAKGER